MLYKVAYQSGSSSGGGGGNIFGIVRFDTVFNIKLSTKKHEKSSER